MSMMTNFRGRVRNTSLPASKAMLPLYEAVINSIQAIEDLGEARQADGRIVIRILREALQLFDAAKRPSGPAPGRAVRGFEIEDNGIGFNDANLRSFQTLDSDLKQERGCRGVGRLVWLKAFADISVVSTYLAPDHTYLTRSFRFTEDDLTHLRTSPSEEPLLRTVVCLDAFRGQYQERAPKSARVVAHGLLEHCLWHFVRPGGAPQILLIDDEERIDLDTLFEEHMGNATRVESITIEGVTFELTHVRSTLASRKDHIVAWCAAGRVVSEVNLGGKIPGLRGPLRDDQGEFTYCCYVSSPYLDDKVRPERIGFDLDLEDDLFTVAGPSFRQIEKAIVERTREHLGPHLEELRSAANTRLRTFVSTKAPRYRAVVKRAGDHLDVTADMTDKELDLLLHKQLAEYEAELREQGHELLARIDATMTPDLQKKLADYRALAGDLKESDLASYVFRRKEILTILGHALKRRPDGKYVKEDVIHDLIMPMQTTSDDIGPDEANLWILDERLAFHHFLASDKTLRSMPITASESTKEPDLCALTLFDEPVLVSDTETGPFASLVIVEIKRPMRNDAKPGEDKDPIEQTKGYLKRIRAGGVSTAHGRPVMNAPDVPAFIHIVCDMTPTMRERCESADMTLSHDGTGYFSFHKALKAYITVTSYDGVLKGAAERNHAFFQALGLPG
jgi:hypothetical protein